MPPRRKAEAPAPAFPFGELPEAARHAIAEQLVVLDRLACVVNVCKDIAALTCASTELRGFGRGLWAKLGSALEPTAEDEASGDSPPEWKGAPKRLHHELRFYDEFSTWPRGEYGTTPTEGRVAALAARGVAAGLPRRVAGEWVRLRSVGLSASKAAAWCAVTPGDLVAIPHVTINVPFGVLTTIHVYKIDDVLLAARRRHGSSLGLEAVLKERAARAAARAADKAAAPRPEKDSAGVEAWARKHTSYSTIHASLLADKEKKAPGAAGGSAGASLNKKEQRRLLGICVAGWVHEHHGGDVGRAVASAAIARATETDPKKLAATVRGLFRVYGPQLAADFDDDDEYLGEY